jgi:mutator family transposase
MVAAAIRTIFAQPDAALSTTNWTSSPECWPPAPTLETMLRDSTEELLAFTSFPPSHWKKIWSTDESFKARVALSAGWDGISLLGGRGRPRSEEQGRGAGSPAAQLAP